MVTAIVLTSAQFVLLPEKYPRWPAARAPISSQTSTMMVPMRMVASWKTDTPGKSRQTAAVPGPGSRQDGQRPVGGVLAWTA
jgi:hypothetical protein